MVSQAHFAMFVDSKKLRSKNIPARVTPKPLFPYSLSAEAGEALVCKITNSPNTDGVPQGFHGNVNCSVELGGPADTITWTKDGKELQDSSNTFWSALRLDNVSQEDTGKYKCSVRKDRQRDQVSFVLHVFGKLNPFIPKIEKLHSPNFLMRNV